MGVVALDSNIFIRALDDPGPLGEEPRKLLKKLKANASKIFISVMVLEEFFVKVYKTGREADSNNIIDFITMEGLVQLVDINRQIALLSARIRADYNVKAPDAIHLASAIESGATVFITTDKRLPKKVGKLTIKVLS